MSIFISNQYSLDSDENYEVACETFSNSDIEWAEGLDMGDADYYQYEQICGSEDRHCVLYTANDDEIARVSSY